MFWVSRSTHFRTRVISSQDGFSDAKRDTSVANVKFTNAPIVHRSCAQILTLIFTLFLFAFKANNFYLSSYTHKNLFDLKRDYSNMQSEIHSHRLNVLNPALLYLSYM